MTEEAQKAIEVVNKMVECVLGNREDEAGYVFKDAMHWGMQHLLREALTALTRHREKERATVKGTGNPAFSTLMYRTVDEDGTKVVVLAEWFYDEIIKLNEAAINREDATRTALEVAAKPIDVQSCENIYQLAGLLSTQNFSCCHPSYALAFLKEVMKWREKPMERQINER